MTTLRYSPFVTGPLLRMRRYCVPAGAPSVSSTKLYGDGRAENVDRGI